LNEKITEQGEKIRKLKSEKAAKVIINLKILTYIILLTG